jgi:hypothetical protein
MKQTQPELLDLCRTSLQGALDWMKTSLENAERLQNQQLIAMRSALVQESAERHDRSALSMRS